MAIIRVYLCAGLPAFAILVAILMARATSSNGGTDNSGRVMIRSMNQQERDQQLISAVSKFDVLRDFKKGDTHSRLTDLKRFLATFGYLPRICQQNTPPTALFDDCLEAALRLYQSNFNLSVMGILDKETLAILRVPRILSNDNVSRLPTESKLTGDKIMWQTIRNLTYAFSNPAVSAILSSDDIRSAVASAFQSWAAVVPIDFQETDDFEAANIKIQFVAGDHGDGWSSDGHLGEVWTVSMAITDDSSAMDLETVALHEIGHLIGLDHSNVYASVMSPNLESRKVKRQLTGEDIDGATALYGPARTSRQDYDFPDHMFHAELENHSLPRWLSVRIIIICIGSGVAFAVAITIILSVYMLWQYIKRRCFWMVPGIITDTRNAANPTQGETELTTVPSNQ